MPFSIAGWLNDSPLRPFSGMFERLLGLTELNRLYCTLPEAGGPFCDRALGALEIECEVNGPGVGGIPSSGPLVVIANHPFGALDGLSLLSVLSRVRQDVKLLGNHLLARIPDLADSLIPIDPFGDSRSRPANAAAIRSAVKWVKSGGALIVFPAGEVAHASATNAVPADSPWSAATARLISLSGADVVPVFFHGRNSRLFSAIGRVHAGLRTALLARELLNRRGTIVRCTVGSCIAAGRLTRFDDSQQLISYLRIRTHALASSSGESTGPGPFAGSSPGMIGVAPEQSAIELERDVRALDRSCQMLASGPYDVMIARASDIPSVLLEIGRLREIVFRGAGEGSGQSRDLDRFDAHYRHLFIWNRERREVVGAYRIGATDEILDERGISGLYTNTLFRYDARLLSQIDPALELGRAFVRHEYQKDYSPLMLLWKGIGAFVSRHPRYRTLFGPVSISNSYQSLSRQILVRFLYATSYGGDLADLVTPRNPPSFLQHRRGLSPVAGSVVRTLADVGSLLAEIESDRKGVPVLLRQYLKLNARLLGFNVDPSFGNVLDGLMLVDLADVDSAIMNRYMGAEYAAPFRNIS